MTTVTLGGVPKVDLVIPGALMADNKHTDPPMARTVLMIPEDGRAALRAAALDEGLDMGEFVFQVLQTDKRYMEALERVRKRKGGRK